MKSILKRILSIVLTLIIAFPILSIMAFADAPSQYDTEGYSNGFGYSYDDKGNLWITDVSNTSLSLYDIPSKLNGKNVYGIGSLTFCDCTKEFQVNIPDSVKEIDQATFDGIDGPDISFPRVSKIVVNANNKNYYSDSNGVLFNKDKTELIKCPSAYKASQYVIPDSVIKIASGAFYECNNIKSFEINDKIKEIGYLAFGKTGAYFNDSCWDKGVLYIGNYLVDCNFERLDEDVVVKEGTFIIAEKVFAYCNDYIKTLTVPKSVTYIGNDIFYACDDVTIYCYRNSYAYQYAIDNDYKYKLLTTDDNLYNRGEETYSFTNFSDSDAGGHCFGMSMTSSGYYLGCLDVSQIGVDNCQKLYTLSKTQKVKTPICEYQNKQGCSNQAIVAGGSKYLKHINNITRDWDEVINYVKNHEYDNKGLLQVAFRKGDEGHAVNFLRYEVIDGQDRIYVYDNNFPNAETYLYKATPSDIREASPYQTFSGSLDTVALRDVTKYFRAVESYDETRYISANESEIKIVFAEKVYIDGGNESADVIYKLPEDDTEVVVIPLVDNAEFEYLDKTYSFGKIDSETVGIFKLSELNGSTVTGKPSLKITERPDVDISVYADDIVMDYAMNARIHPIIEITEGVKYSIEYYSSNPNKIDVEEDGSIVAHKRGKELIYITVTDEYGHEAKDVLNVKVKFTIFQWFIWIFLLGFLWY